MAFKYNYSEERSCVEWQRKVDEIRRRDNYTCRICGTQNKQVHVHHTWYNQDLHYCYYPNHQYLTLCCNCHEKETILYRKFKTLKQYVDSDVWDSDVWESVCSMLQEGIPLLKLVNMLHMMDENTELPFHSKKKQNTQKDYQFNDARYLLMSALMCRRLR